VDFWWDEFPSNHGNCWFDNTAMDGSKNYTSDPPPPPQHGQSIPGFLPEDCSNDAGTTGLGDPQKEAVLGACATDVETGSQEQDACDWFRAPPKPGPNGNGNGTPNAGFAAGHDVAAGLPSMCTLIGDSTTLVCSPFRHRLGG
jgi:hypothetical protein